jgi:hypothetical protein
MIDSQPEFAFESPLVVQLKLPACASFNLLELPASGKAGCEVDRLTWSTPAASSSRSSKSSLRTAHRQLRGLRRVVLVQHCYAGPGVSHVLVAASVRDDAIPAYNWDCTPGRWLLLVLVPRSTAEPWFCIRYQVCLKFN